jgi:outer membrane protein TolC
VTCSVAPLAAIGKRVALGSLLILGCTLLLPTADIAAQTAGPAVETDSFTRFVSELQLGEDETETANGDEAGLLTLADVIASLYRYYPEIARARGEIPRTGGELLGAWGAFDTKLGAFTINEPTGFYENYRHGIGAARDTWWGGYLSAGYRVGRGDFQPWYKERQTDEGGEFKFAYNQSLLQGRAIDANRVAIFQASLARQMAEPVIQQTLLQYSREASMVYWQWVAAGAVLEAQRELLELAETRGEQFRIGVEAGKFPEIDLILNQQLIAERRAKLLETEQKFRATALKLSLYLRNETGQPLIPGDDWLPDRFPVIEPPPIDLQQELNAALLRRPEPRILQLEIQQNRWERQLACNNQLPRVDLISEASQDVGAPATSSNDKGEFELILGIQAEVPVQRRKARGKVQSTSAKIAQLSEKLRLQRDKIGAELLTEYNRLQLFAQIVEQADLSLRAAFDSLDRFRFAFEQGKVDLIYLNLLETKANETEIKLVEAQRDWFDALSALQTALGLDPLDQAMIVSELPASDRPGPGRLPNRSTQKPADNDDPDDDPNDAAE